MSWIISHAISAVKSETPQVTASTVSPRALNACASKDQLYFVPPKAVHEQHGARRGCGVRLDWRSRTA
jgi:hypothetical protein